MHYAVREHYYVLEGKLGSPHPLDIDYRVLDELSDGPVPTEVSCPVCAGNQVVAVHGVNAQLHGAGINAQ